MYRTEILCNSSIVILDYLNTKVSVMLSLCSKFATFMMYAIWTISISTLRPQRIILFEQVITIIVMTHRCWPPWMKHLKDVFFQDNRPYLISTDNLIHCLIRKQYPNCWTAMLYNCVNSLTHFVCTIYYIITSKPVHVYCTSPCQLTWLTYTCNTSVPSDSPRCAQGSPWAGPPLENLLAYSYCQFERCLWEHLYGPSKSPGGHGMVRALILCTSKNIVVASLWQVYFVKNLKSSTQLILAFALQLH